MTDGGGHDVLERHLGEEGFGRHVLVVLTPLSVFTLLNHHQGAREQFKAFSPAALLQTAPPAGIELIGGTV